MWKTGNRGDIQCLNLWILIHRLSLVMHGTDYECFPEKVISRTRKPGPSLRK